MANLGKWAQNTFGRDITPGFNIGWKNNRGSDFGFAAPTITSPGDNPRTSRVEGSGWGGGKRGGGRNTAPNTQGGGTPQAPSGGAYSGGGGSGGGGGAAPKPAYSPEELAQFDQAIGMIRGNMGRIPGQLNVAHRNIQDQFNVGRNELNSAKKQARSSYDTSATQNQQSYRTDKNTIADQASSGLRGLLRMLGAYGAGGSSEAQFVAPQAVTDVASQQRAGAGQNFAQNEQSLDTNWNNFLTEDENSRDKLLDWRTQQQRQARQTSTEAKQDLLSKLADLTGKREALIGGSYSGAAQPFLDQANRLGGRIDQLGRFNPRYSGRTPVYEAPSLDEYTAEQTAAPEARGDEDVSPFLSLLLGNRDEEDRRVF